MKILFIQTGGTIDKDYPGRKGGYAFEINEPAVLQILNRLNPSFDYKVISAFQKDSLDITDEDREILYRTCRESKFERIIITHGTDTIIKTAEKLSRIRDKVIILVGSFLPERFKDSDADVNLGVAIGAVNVLDPGVYIAMNGQILKPDSTVRKDDGKFFELD